MRSATTVLPLILLLAAATVGVAAFGVRPGRRVGAGAIGGDGGGCTVRHHHVAGRAGRRRGNNVAASGGGSMAIRRRGGVVGSSTALAAMADVHDDGNRSDDSSSSQPQSSQELQLVQAWLSTHLPALPQNDLQSYASQLCKDGFTTPEQLRELNTGKSGRVEDLYFMKKGHRRVLTKKLGVMRNVRGRKENRLGREEEGDGGGSREDGRGDGMGERGTPKGQPRGETRDTSIEEWLEEQNRMVEERRLARLAEEERASQGGDEGKMEAADSSGMSTDKARRVDRLRNEFGAPSRTESAVPESPQEAGGDVGAEEEEDEASPQSKVDVASPAEQFRQRKQRTSAGENRSLDELRRDFLAPAAADAGALDDAEEMVDDLTARYQSLDAGPRGEEARDKEVRRLAELRRAFLRRHNADAPRDDPIDDLTARYDSLDKASFEDGAARSKELARLEELQREFLRKRRNRDAPGEDPADDLSARYRSLDKDSLEDGAARDKQSRRLDEIRREFARRRTAAAARAVETEEDPLDDLSARYRSLDKDTLEDGAARDKQSRRLEELRREFARRKAAAARTVGEKEEPLDDLTARYQSMNKDLLEDGSARDKGSRRLEEMKREFARRKAAAGANAPEEDEPLRVDLLQRKETDEAVVDGKERKRMEEFQRLAQRSDEKKEDRHRRGREDARDVAERRSASEGGARIRKSNEERRLEDIERYFDKRRAARIAEEERLEQMLLEAKMAALKEDDGVESEEEGRDPPSAKDLWEAVGNMALDDFFEERPVGSASLSTTMPPPNVGKKGGKKTGPSATKKEAAPSDAGLYEYTDITKNNLRERKTLSLSTTMPPSNRGVLSARRPSEKESKKDEEDADEMPAAVGKKRVENGDSAGPNLDEYTDITVSNIRERENLSLSTTMPPTNEGASAVRRPSKKDGGGQDDDSEECIGEDCWDITRGSFSERESQSLATTLPPKNKPANNAPSERKEAEEIATSEAREDGSFYDITQNLFPEGQPPDRSAFEEGEKSEMNARPPNSSSPKRGAAKSDGAASYSSTSSENEKSEMNSRASALYQRVRSERRSTFTEGERSEMNGRPPQPVSGRSAPQWTRKPGAGADSVLDILSQFPKDRPSASVNTGTKKDRLTTSGTYEESKRLARSEDESSMDIRMNFPKERPSTLVNTGTPKDPKATKRSEEKREQVASPAREVDDSYMDIMTNFPEERPSMLVNTGTPKVPKATRRSEESREQPASPARDVDDSYMDIMSNFPEERPSMLVNTGTQKDRMATSGSHRESKERSSKAAQREDDSYMDIMTSFPKERPSSWANTGTVRRETSRSSSNDESYRNIAHNFSTDGASLRGHPKRKEIGSTSTSSTGDSDFLDVHQFSGKLSRGSQAKAVATTAAWRDPSFVKNGEKYLDTPSAFADGLDMMSAGAGATKKRAQSAGSTSPSSVRYSSAVNRELEKASAVADQPFLDKPRVFQSGVDMVSSNFSGKQFKRSSDIPPEEKNAKDQFDVTTEPMPDIDRMAMVKERKTVGPSTTADEPFTDITRSSMSRLERASSAVKDANSALKARSKSNTPVSGQVSAKATDGEGVDSAGAQSEGSSFEQVMWWLLGHLPNLQEEDAIHYFHCFLEDGFDSLDSVEELREEDLHFMKSGHRRALLRSIQSEVAEDTDAEEGMVNESSLEPKGNATPDDTFDKARAELEKTEAWIAEQNRLVEERLAARLAEDKVSAPEKKDSAPMQRGSEDPKPKKAFDFVGRASMSQVAPNSMVTRDSFPDRPSLSSQLPSSLSNGKQPSSVQRSQKEAIGYTDEEEVFDITRDAFQEDL